MRALVLPPCTVDSAGSATRDLARPILGVPLAHRQLSWLRDNGVDDVVIARADHDRLPSALQPEALRAAGVGVSYLPTSPNVALSSLLRRLTPKHESLIVVPHAALGDVSLAPAIALAEDSKRDVLLTGWATGVRVLAPGSQAASTLTMTGRGTLETIGDEASAHRLMIDALEGRRPDLVVRGSEIAPGVFVARGAVIEEGATVIGPAYVGPGAHIVAGATVGPSAILDEGAIVERGATVRFARIAENTIVGAGVRVERAVVEGDRLTGHRGRSHSFGDPLLLGARPGRPGDAVARALGALGAAAATFVPRTAGERPTWLAFLERARQHEAAPLTDAELRLMLPADAPAESREAVARLYVATRTPGTDLSLAWSALLGRTRGVAL
jgi:hypothetical protein